MAPRIDTQLYLRLRTISSRASSSSNSDWNEQEDGIEKQQPIAAVTTSTASTPGGLSKQSRWQPSPKMMAGIVGISTGILAVAFTPLASLAWDPSSITTASSWYAGLMQTGFYQAFSLVFVSEIGDKTFFIAGLLAMKTSRLLSFLGSMAALGAMTIVSVIIGQVFHAVPNLGADGSLPLDDIAAVLAFAFFGIKTLKEALAMDESGEGKSGLEEEFEEAQEAVEGQAISDGSKFGFGAIASIFGLVFAAEFGDRSFLSTIALSAAQNPVSVAAGAIAAHAVATGVAVLGGSYVAKYLSERVIGIIGGTLFLVFAVTTALGVF